MAIAGCGSAARPAGKGTDVDHRSGARKAEKTIDVYSSLPLSGPQAAQGLAIEQGIKTAFAVLEQPAGHVNGYKLKYTPLNDANSAGWSATRAAARAQLAASDPSTGIFIGDLNSGATEVSLPILNQAGIVDVTPGSAFVGLTNYVEGGVTPLTEPDRFYPNAKLRNLLRLIPDEMVQASAILDAFTSALPCPSQRVAAVSFGGTAEGSSFVFATQVTARAYGLTFVPTKPLASSVSAAELTAYVQYLHSLGVGCLVLTGRSTATASALMRLLRADLPRDTVIGTSGYCGRPSGLPDSYCASPVLPLSKLTGGEAYVQDYQQVFSTRRQPNPYGVYGFIAAELAVAAIDEADGSDVRQQLQVALLGGDAVQSSQIIGAIKFDSHGNLVTDRRVGLYRYGPSGLPQLVTVITPSADRIVGGG